jgi:hypothetical protein
MQDFRLDRGVNEIAFLRAGRPGDRIPMGARFSTPVQNGPGAHPVSYAMGTVSFPGVKRPRRDTKFKETADLYLFPPLGLRSLFWGGLYFLDVTQRTLVVTDVSGQTVCLIFKGQTLEED